MRAILGAKKSVFWELYIFLDDEAGKPFFDALEQKARSGVDVKLVVDAIGSFFQKEAKNTAVGGDDLFLARTVKF